MMNKRIRSMIDEIFAEMKMSAENLALRDELMANAQARFEDTVAQGASEEQAFAQVASSLGDVSALLREMNGGEPEAAEAVETPEKFEAAIEIEAGETEEETKAEPQEAAEPQKAEAVFEINFDAAEDKKEEASCEAGAQKGEAAPAAQELNLGDTLNRAFAELGKFGQSLMPQAKKIVREVDKASGGMIEELGKAVSKGMQDAKKAAGDTIDKFSGDQGELVFEFGKKKDKEIHSESEKPADSAELRRQAEDLRAQALLKDAVGDSENAEALRNQAELLDTQAEAADQAKALEDALAAAQPEEPQTPEEPEAPQESVYGADGELNEDAFARTVDHLTGEAERIAREAERDAVHIADEAERMAERVAGAAERMADDVVRRVTRSFGDGESISGGMVFPVAGLHNVDIKLDADNVIIEPADGQSIVVSWDTSEGSKPEAVMVGHTLSIRRPNPDVFKTFFSVFKQSGGEIRVGVPRGYACSFAVTTTSGDIRLSALDVDNVKIGTTSGDVRVEPDPRIRCKHIEVGTVSGDVTVSACAEDIKVNTVSGDQYVSCDVRKVDVSTVSGDVRIEGACDEWEADSVSGDIDMLCTIATARKMQVSTMSGDAHIALPGDVRGFVADISGMSGSIQNEFGPNRYGTCALPIHMDTMSGSLLITRL